MTQSKVLIIEDDEGISFLLDFLLRKDGFDVTLAKDGKAAKALIEQGQQPDIVLLDIMLPYVDGLQLLKLLRGRAGWHNVPVLMLTSKNQNEDIIRALDAGASDFVTKPFEPMELLLRMKRLINLGQA